MRTLTEIQKRNPPSSNSNGSNQGGIPRETPRGEPRKNPNEKCIPIKAIDQCRTSEGAYRGVISRWTPTNAPGNTQRNSKQCAQKKKQYTYFQPSRNLAVTPKTGNLSKLRIGEIKMDTLKPQYHLIPEEGKSQKSSIIVARTITHKYTTRSITKRVNHVTTFKNAPSMFTMDTSEKLKHI